MLVTRRRPALASALIVMAAFAAGMVQEFYHTDDGCPVEIHCLACQRVLMSTGVSDPPLTLVPSLEPALWVVAPAPASTPRADVPASPSRGPPLA